MFVQTKLIAMQSFAMFSIQMVIMLTSFEPAGSKGWEKLFTKKKESQIIIF